LPLVESAKSPSSLPLVKSYGTSANACFSALPIFSKMKLISHPAMIALCPAQHQSEYSWRSSMFKTWEQLFAESSRHTGVFKCGRERAVVASYAIE
jgi:hypothetical protein